MGVGDPRLNERLSVKFNSDEREPNVGVSVLLSETLAESVSESCCRVGDTVCEWLRDGPELVDERDRISDTDEVRLNDNDAVSEYESGVADSCCVVESVVLRDIEAVPKV